MQYVLEIAAFTLRAAQEAEKAGAHRIELCGDASGGGCTPSYGMMCEAIEQLNIPVFPIIRPRPGDFVYNETELESMKRDIALCKALGFAGVVTGALKPNGSADMAVLEMLQKTAYPMQVTFHRAFDRCRDPLQMLEQLIELGYTRILSSGQHPSVQQGYPLLSEIIQKAADRIIIMPGSGLNSRNVQDIAVQTGAFEFHTAARKNVHDGSLYNPASMHERLEHTGIDPDEIAAIRKVLDSIE